MGKTLLRYIFVVAVLMLLLGGSVFGTNLQDAYAFLTVNGWSSADALGFLAVSLLSSAKLNPSVGAVALAGALSGYILANGMRLGELLMEYMNSRKGVALLGPISNISAAGVILVAPGECRWSSIRVSTEYVSWSKTVIFAFGYSEYRNNNGSLEPGLSWSYSGNYSYSAWGSVKDTIVSKLQGALDNEGRSVAQSFLSVMENNWLAKNKVSLSVSRELVADGSVQAGEGGKAVQYTPVLKPVLSDEDVGFGLGLLSDPDAFLEWARNLFGEDGIFEKDNVDDLMESMLNEIKAQLNNLGLYNADVYNKVNEIYNYLNNEVSQKVSNVENVTNEINNKVSSVLNKADEMNNKMDSVTNAINELKQMVQNLQGQSGAVDLSEVIARLDAMESVLKSAVSGVDAKVQALSDAVSGMQQTMEEGKGILESIKEWLDKFWDDLFAKWQEFLSGEWFLEWVKWLYHTLVVPEEYQQVWNDVVAGWKEKVKFDVDIGSKLNVSGDSISDFSIPVGSWSIPVHLSSYVQMLGLRQLITTIVIASMWLGVLFAIIPKFVI